jgi:hypothetical protein
VFLRVAVLIGPGTGLADRVGADTERVADKHDEVGASAGRRDGRDERNGAGRKESRR